MFALLGEIPFEVLGSPETFESSRHFDYAEHRVIEDRPRLQWLAADLESITLAMLFHTSFTDPAAQLAGLLAAANDHQARALVLGNGAFRGFFVVESVATSDIQLGADAAPIAIRVRANLREWAPGSEFDPAAPPRLATVPLGLAPVAISYSPPIPLGPGVPAANYAAPTFNQPGVSPLVDNPLPGGAGGAEPLVYRCTRRCHRQVLAMSAPQFIQHLTQGGERWDLLAWQYYGDATNYSIIIMANPGLPIEPVFEAGISLAIPIIQQQSMLTSDLPPWKTAGTTVPVS